MKKFNMKKTTAAAVAAAVGAVLLLGGAGTLAYWQDTASSATQIVSAGKLDLGTVDTASGAWKVSKDAAVTFETLSGKVVPGDIVKAEFLVPVELVGQNLKSELKVTPATPAGTLSTKATVKVGIATDTPVVLPTTATTPATSVTRAFNPTTLAAASTNGKVKVTVTVEFPFNATPTAALDNTSMEAELSAITLAYELKQIAN